MWSLDLKKKQKPWRILKWDSETDLTTEECRILYLTKYYTFSKKEKGSGSSFSDAEFPTNRFTGGVERAAEVAGMNKSDPLP